jgi:glycolate oxidase iron-sulfur subunit
MNNINPNAGPELCVRCGKCKASCPTYIEFANEGMSGRGRIELIVQFLSDEIDPSGILDERIYTCLLCGACDNSCPRGISVTGAFYEARKKLALTWNARRLYRTGVKYAFTNPAIACNIFRFLDQTGLKALFGRSKLFRAIKKLGVDIPDNRLKNDISVFRTSEPRGRVALFAGCAVDFLYPQMGAAFIKALNNMDFEVVLAKGECCCGAPLLGMGLTDEAESLARKNLDTFGMLNVDAVITLCPTCAHFIRDVYKDIIGEGITNATDISKFICDSSLISCLKPSSGNAGRVMYHDPCHSVNYLKSVAEPRAILRALGIIPEEPAEKGCCGMGNAVRLLNDKVSDALLGKRAASFDGADMIVTSCPNCVMQLGSLSKERPVRHIIELIAAGTKGKRS